jgi:uncharacterized protein YoxC
MNPDFKVSLDIAQIVLLCGLVWGLAKMSGMVDRLREVTASLSAGLDKIKDGLNDLTGRVRVLEDRRRHP